MSFSLNFLAKIELLNETGYSNSRNPCQFRQCIYQENHIKKHLVPIFHTPNSTIHSTTLFFLADVNKTCILPIYKKKRKASIENYRQISILFKFSKICYGCMVNQMYS